MTEDKYRLEESWKDTKGNELKLVSCEGKWHKILGTKKEDRLFFIQINDSGKFPIKHSQQIYIMKNILKNDLLPHRFKQNCTKFKDAIKLIEEEWYDEHGSS